MSDKAFLSRHGEHGGARVKLVVFLVVFAIVLYVGYLYVPVAVDAYQFKDFLQNKVDLAVTQGYDTNWVKDQVTKGLGEYHVPPEAIITPAQKDNRVEVRVQFIRPISLPGYTYNYEFDYTARSTAFIAIK